jgi:hypothetical protein
LARSHRGTDAGPHPVPDPATDIKLFSNGLPVGDATAHGLAEFRADRNPDANSHPNPDANRHANPDANGHANACTEPFTVALGQPGALPVADLG